MPIDSRLINKEAPNQLEDQILITGKAESILAGGMFGTPDQPETASPYLTQYKAEPQEDYSFGQITQSAFEQENTVGSTILDTQYNFINEVDPNFDPISYVFDEIDNSIYAPYSEEFLNFKNRKDADLYKQKLQREFKNREVLANSGLTGFAMGMAAGILDPINLLPIGGGAYKAYKAGKYLKGIGLTAGAGAVGMTASEGILQATQETRTLEESIINVGAGTILAGALGGASAMLSKRQFNKLAKKLEADIQNETSDFQINPDTQKFEIKPDSASAASVAEFESLRKYYDDVLTPQLKAEGKEIPSFKDFKKQQQSLETTLTQDIAKAIKGEKILKKINAIDKLNPIQRLTQTKFATAPKEIAEKLMKTGLMFQKNKLGIASAQSAEISKKQLQATYFNKYKPAENEAWYNFKKRVKKEGAKNTTEQNIKDATQFYEELSRSLRNGDVSDIPEVQELAKNGRNEVLNKLGQEAVDVGLLNEKVLKSKPKTAESYFPRLFNKLKVIARENDLRGLLTDTIKTRLLPNIKRVLAEEQLEIIDDISVVEREISTLKTKLDNLDGQPKEVKDMVKEKINKLNAKLKKLENKKTENEVSIRSKFEEVGDEDQYISEIVDDIVNTLKGEDRLGLIDDLGIKVGKRGPLKERTLNFIQDNELEPWLENDGSKVLNYYQNTLSTDIAIARAFDGDLTLDDAITKINDEYKEAKKGIIDENQLIAIEKERKAVINDIDSTLKIMRGMYARPDNPDSTIVRGGRVARQFNYATKMGMVAFASITDLANPIAKHGLATWGKTLPNLIFNLKSVKLLVKEAKFAGNITDVVMPERMASFSGLSDPFASNTSAFERVLENINKSMSKLNLMPLWNDFQKSFSSIITQYRMINSINNYENLKQKDIQYLAYLGIGRDNYRTILKELKTHAYKEGNLWVANTEKWQNPEAVRLYRNALNIDVDSTIVTVGAGDLPLWAQTEAGKVVAQFKSFVFGATQQVLVANLQRKDLAALSGFISAVGLGMFSYYLRKQMAGKEVSNDPIVWINEGLDRSGYLGILAEYSHIADKVGLGFATMTGAGELSRYQTRSFASSLLGPTIGTINDLAIGTSALVSGERTPADAKAIRRMIFLNNTAFLNNAMDNFEKSIVNK